MVSTFFFAGRWNNCEYGQKDRKGSCQDLLCNMEEGHSPTSTAPPETTLQQSCFCLISQKNLFLPGDEVPVVHQPRLQLLRDFHLHLHTVCEHVLLGTGRKNTSEFLFSKNLFIDTSKVNLSCGGDLAVHSSEGKNGLFKTRHD